jgi:hypothetical protein
MIAGINSSLDKVIDFIEKMNLLDCKHGAGDHHGMISVPGCAGMGDVGGNHGRETFREGGRCDTEGNFGDAPENAEGSPDRFRHHHEGYGF